MKGGFSSCIQAGQKVGRHFWEPLNDGKLGQPGNNWNMIYVV